MKLPNGNQAIIPMSKLTNVNQLTHLDTIANLHPISRDRLTLVEPRYQMLESLPVGQVGTVSEIHDRENPQYLVEFADSRSWESAVAILNPDEILVLHYELSLVG